MMAWLEGKTNVEQGGAWWRKMLAHWVATGGGKVMHSRVLSQGGMVLAMKRKKKQMAGGLRS